MGDGKNLGIVYLYSTFLLLSAFLLLDRIGFAVPIWQPLVQYWPLLILAWGLVKVADYFRMGRARRLLFSRTEAGMLVVMLLTGSMFTAIVRLGWDLSFLGIATEDLNLPDFLGARY